VTTKLILIYDTLSEILSLRSWKDVDLFESSNRVISAMNHDGDCQHCSPKMAKPQ
jgi:hypothetical protein